MTGPMLRVDGLSVAFRTAAGEAMAVRTLDLTLAAGETLALVGESGSGKSAAALSLMRLLEPAGRIAKGRIRLDGVDLSALPEADMRRRRGRDLAMVFQEPMTSLNPVLTVGEQIAEALAAHGGTSLRAAFPHARALLDLVGIAEPDRRLHAFPHELSGGQRQRVVIAMALIGRPKLLIADEPTTALDVTVQAQILRLFRRLQREFGMGILLISHDFGVVAGLADRVAVMYAGEKVEEAPVEALYATPQHPYTRTLLALATPRQGFERHRLPELPGSQPSPLADAPGCRFAPRCPSVLPRCHGARPVSLPLGGGHTVACFAVEKERGIEKRHAAAHATVVG